MTATSGVSATGDQRIDGLISGVKWGVSNLTYSFPTSADYYGYSGEKSTFGVLSDTAQDAVRDILEQFSAVANITFNEITETDTDHATLRFADSN